MRKRALLILAGLASVVTLRSIRKRRVTRTEDAQSTATEALEEARTATEHASAAASHGKNAGEKAGEYAREKVDVPGR